MNYCNKEIRIVMASGLAQAKAELMITNTK